MVEIYNFLCSYMMSICNWCREDFVIAFEYLWQPNINGWSNENYEVDLKKEMMCLVSMHGFVDARVERNYLVVLLTRVVVRLLCVEVRLFVFVSWLLFLNCLLTFQKLYDLVLFLLTLRNHHAIILDQMQQCLPIVFILFCRL